MDPLQSILVSRICERRELMGVAKRAFEFLLCREVVHQMHARRGLCDFAKLLPAYSCYQRLPNSWHRVDPFLPENNVFTCANFVFARNE